MKNPRLIRYDDSVTMEEHLLQKFLRGIRKLENGCWTCDTALPMGHGYAEVKIGRGKRGVFRQTVHVLSFQHFKGLIPDGMLVCHSCDNRPCCNPDHLFPGTYVDNQADMAAKDRVAFGERHYRAKLSEDDVILIYQLGKTGMLHREIAGRFGVSRSRVGSILNGTDWKRLYEQHVVSAHV